MNVAVIYNKKQIKFADKLFEIKRKLESYQIRCNLIYLNNKNKYDNFDIYIILSDELSEIEKYIKKYDLQNKKKLFIITENLEVNHILGCIDITLNLIYLHRNIEEVAKDFIRYIKI